VVLKESEELELMEGVGDGLRGVGGEDGEFISDGGPPQAELRPQDGARVAFDGADEACRVAKGHKVAQGRLRAEPLRGSVGASPARAAAVGRAVMLDEPANVAIIAVVILGSSIGRATGC
jgi:hypothetical protein